MSDPFLNIPPYTYQPLEDASKQIRLIHARRNSHGTISCDLKTFPTLNLPSYQALSYTWGSSTPVHKILVNKGYLAIRSNLYHFLSEITALHMYFWIDQLSINQYDISERNLQVPLMGFIFARASHVTIWLGNNPVYTNAALTFTSPSADESCKADALATLMRDAYFSRLWIVQEVLLAADLRTMIFSHMWIPWKAISGFTYIDALSTRNISQPALALLELSTNEVAKHDFCFYAVNFARNECANALDRVYGLLGLVDAQLHIVPDYQKSGTQVFADVVLALCRGYVQGRLKLSRPFAYAMWVLGESLGVTGVKPWRLRGLYEGVVRAVRRRRGKGGTWGIEIGVEGGCGESGTQGESMRWWLEVDGKRAWY